MFFIPLLVFAFCLGGHSQAVAQPADTLVVFVSPSDTTVYEKDPFQLAIHLDADTTQFMGYNVTVRFDTTYLKIVSVDEGSLPLNSGYLTFFEWLNPGGLDDSVHVNGAILGHTTLASGELFVMTFEPLQSTPNDTPTRVEITASVIRNGINENIDHRKEDGLVKIDLDIPVENITWGAVKHAFKEP
jgi:hypothetical protein